MGLIVIAQHLPLGRQEVGPVEIALPLGSKLPGGRPEEEGAAALLGDGLDLGGEIRGAQEEEGRRGSGQTMSWAPLTWRVSSA